MLSATFLLSLFFPNIFGPSLLPSGGQTEELIPTDRVSSWKMPSNLSNKGKNRRCVLWYGPIRGSPAA